MPRFCGGATPAALFTYHQPTLPSPTSTQRRPAIPYPKLEDTPAEYQVLVAGNPKQILAMWANAPATIKLVCLWGQAQFTQLELSPSDRELVILLTGAR